MFKIKDGRENFFFQWDLNQKLIVNDESITEVHFCNKTDDCALVVEVRTEDGVRVADVPNVLLQNDWCIRAYAYTGTHTLVEKRFKVSARSKPADYVYTETEVKSYEKYVQDIELLKESNEATTEAIVNINKDLGNIDNALDRIIEIQNNLLGVTE